MFKKLKISLYFLLFLISISVCATSIKSYQYKGNIIQITDPRGIAVKYEYDNFDRLISKKYPNNRKIQYVYDVVGHRIKLIDGVKTTSFEYDIFGNISKITFPNAQSVQYLYDPLGKLLKLTYPDNSEIYYSYDHSGRLSKIKDVSGTTKYEYDERLNALKKKILPNGTSSEFIYNAARRISNVIHKNKEGELIEEYRYEYDPDGNRVKIERITSLEQSSSSYVYDKLNRIINVKYSNDYFESYTYDELGNRLSKITPNGTINYEYDVENRLIKAGDTRFDYDRAGNLIKKISPEKTAEYIYDADNLLTSYIDNSNRIEFEYDGDGNRTAKIVNGVRTEYINDLSSPITQVLLKRMQKRFFNEEKLIRYVYGSSKISQSCNGETQFYLYDSLGRNVCVLINFSGEMLNNYEYDSFGNVLLENRGIKNVYKYCGEQFDEETGLIYLRNRYYDPEIGRFISKDKNFGNLYNPQTLNSYNYVENNPINFVDPLGFAALSPEEKELVILHSNSWPGWFGGQGPAGHVFMEFPERDHFLGNYPKRKALDESHNIHPMTFSIANKCLSSNVNLGLNKMINIDWTIMHNCAYTAVEGMKAMEFKHAEKIKLHGIPSPQELKHQMLKFYNHDPEGLSIIDHKHSNFNKPLGVNESPFNINSSPSLDYGGISLSKRAELQLNLLDIGGAAFDQKSGQIILFGKENLYLPKVNMDDLAVAVKSIYGIGLDRAQDPGISIDPIAKDAKDAKMSVRYDGATENTYFGLTMFEADRLLKCLALGKDNITQQPLTANVAGFISLFDRMEKDNIDTLRARLWFVPEQITLIEGEDSKGFVFNEVKMQVLTEAQKFKYLDDVSHCVDFAKHFTEHYDEFAKQFPVFEKLKDLGKITAIIKWIKDNNIFFDTSYFVNYKPKFYETPGFTPATANATYRNGRYIVMSGGVVYSFDKNNFKVEKQLFADNWISEVIDSRPSDNDFSWSFQSPINRETFSAVVQSIYRTRKPGNVKKRFCDLYLYQGSTKLQLNRYYNSFSEQSSYFGYGWDFLPYEMKFSLEKVNIINNENKNINTFKTILVKILDKEDFFEIEGFDQDKCPIFINQSRSYFLKENVNGNFSLYSTNGEFIAEFNEKCYLTKTIENAFLVTYEYDQNHLIKIDHEKGLFISFEYQNDKIVKAMGSDGIEIFYCYDLQGLLQKTTDIHGLDTYYFYDKDKRLNKILDHEKNIVFSAVYDDYNRATEVTEGQLKYCSEFSLKEKKMILIDQKGEEIIFQYDEKDRLVQKKEKDKKLNFFYEQEDLLVPTKIVDENGYSTLCKYNNNGQITYLKNFFGAEWQFFYDKRGNLVLEQQPTGRWKSYEYDNNNHLVRIDLKVDEINFAEDKESFSIKSDGFYTFFLDYNNQEEKPKSIRNLIGAKTSFEFNESGDLIQSKMPTGYTKKRVYDDKNRIIQISDNFGIINDYEYNSLDRVQKETSANGIRYYEYNDKGDLIKITDPKGNITNQEYDNQHNLIKVIDSEMGVFRYEYSSDSKIYNIIFPNGTYKSFEYDNDGRLICEVENVQ